MIRGCLTVLAVIAGMVLAAAAAVWVFTTYVDRRIAGPDPVTVANASLQGLREQNRLATFAARYVAVVTSTQSRMGFSARKTLIMPGNVRYEVDLAKLRQQDVRWDARSRTLTIRLPEIEVVGPDVNLTQVREYGEGGVLMTLTNAEAALDAANRRAGQAELIRQAREPGPMNLAREASRRAVERSFTMPLRAVGVEANVRVLFPNEVVNTDRERWDVSRSIEEVLAERARATRN